MGRPLKFQTVEELQTGIDSYFKNTPEDEWTITGLAMALDTFRNVLNDYGSGKYDDDRDFSTTIKKAKAKVENGYEKDLKKHGRSGTIFALKNFDWKDKQETDITTKGEKIETNVNIGLEALAAQMDKTNRSLYETNPSPEGVSNEQENTPVAS